MAINKDLETLLREVSNDLDPRFFQSSCVGPGPTFREIADEEFEVD